MTYLNTKSNHYGRKQTNIRIMDAVGIKLDRFVGNGTIESLSTRIGNIEEYIANLTEILYNSRAITKDQLLDLIGDEYEITEEKK